MARRRLADLYKVGREFVFDDGQKDPLSGQSEPVTVWLQKININQHAEATRRADAQRARLLAARKDHTTEDYLSTLSQVYDLGDRDSLMAYLVADQYNRVLAARGDEIAAKDEWAKDNYLVGLRDAWDDTLQGEFAADPEHEEAKRVLAELRRFDEQVTQRMTAEMDRYREGLADVTEEELQEKVIDRLFEFQASSAWIDEFYRSKIWQSVREPDNHDQRYFASRDEVDTLEPKMITALRRALEDLDVDVVEGKGLPGAPGSSNSSEPSSEAATSDSSGPVTASA